MTGWISVKERLPEMPLVCTVAESDGTEFLLNVSDFVLVASKGLNGYTIYTAQVNEDGEWTNYMGDWAEDVTHWMPLPEPPKTHTDAGDGSCANCEYYSEGMCGNRASNIYFRETRAENCCEEYVEA